MCLVCSNRTVDHRVDRGTKCKITLEELHVVSSSIDISLTRPLKTSLLRVPRCPESALVPPLVLSHNATLLLLFYFYFFNLSACCYYLGSQFSMLCSRPQVGKWFRTQSRLFGPSSRSLVPVHNEHFIPAEVAAASCVVLGCRVVVERRLPQTVRLPCSLRSAVHLQVPHRNT